MQTWEKTNLLNRIERLEVRVTNCEALLVSIVECKPEFIHATSPYDLGTILDLQQIDEVLERKTGKKEG